MIVNTMREVSRPEDFLGHLTGTDFVLVLPPTNLAALSEKLQTRLDQSMEYFYPIKDREQIAKQPSKLMAKIVEIPSLKTKFANVEQIRGELFRHKK